MKTTIASFLAVLLGLGAALACSGDATGGDGVTQLEIVSIEPQDGATNVETGATISATFNVAADRATLTPATFTLSLGAAAQPVHRQTEICAKAANLDPGPEMIHDWLGSVQRAIRLECEKESDNRRDAY